jgi:deoxyhypusine synthase
MDLEKRKKYLSKKVEQITVKPNKTLSELLSEMKNTGFQGKSLGLAFEVLCNMIKEKNNLIIMGLAGSLSTTGQIELIKYLIKNRYIDILVSTGANISEDILHCMGYGYYQGHYLVDDYELFKLKIDRFYDVYADELEYRKMESLIGDFAQTLDEKKIYSSREFLHQFGRYLYERKIYSIVAEAYKQGVLVFSPALIDSGYGIGIIDKLLTHQGKHIVLDQTKDFKEIVQVASKFPTTSAIYIGGGVPKDFIQLVTVEKAFVKRTEDESHKFAIQITTDSPQWGGLSGCTFEEAISWGKISCEANRAVCYVDATIALPILVNALADKNIKRENIPNLQEMLT